MSRAVSLKSGSSSIFIPSYTKVIYLSELYCRWCGFNEICPYISSDGKEPCPCGDMLCNYDHTTGCIREMNIPYLPECPAAVSYSTDADGLPTVTLYDHVWEEGAGKSSWMQGGVPISEDDPDYGFIAKQRTKWIDEYDVDLPLIYKFDAETSDSLPPQVQEDHIKMQYAMMIISIAVADIPPPLRKMYAYAESSAKTFATSEAATKNKEQGQSNILLQCVIQL